MVHRVPLRTAEDRWPPERGMTAVERCVAEYWPGYKTLGLPKETAPGPALVAFVNHGRWMVQCPGCPSATLASRADRRFFCPECSNALDQGKWLPVVWPADADTIEGLLGARRDRRNRHWWPHETADDLAAENAKKGVL